jgi:DNA-binding MarR family transcriptional regulator
MSSRERSRRQDAPNTVSKEALLVNGSDFEFRQFIHDSLAFAARLLAVRDGYGKVIGLTGQQYIILISIAHLAARGPVTVSSVADHLYLSGSFVTTETNKLVRMGLVTKSTDPADRRRVLLASTDEASRRLRELAKVQVQVNDVHFGNLTKKEFDQLRALMPQLLQPTERALSLLEHLSKFTAVGDD